MPQGEGKKNLPVLDIHWKIKSTNQSLKSSSKHLIDSGNTSQKVTQMTYDKQSRHTSQNKNNTVSKKATKRFHITVF